MNYTKQHYQIAVTQLFGFGPIKSKHLIQSVDKIEDIFMFSFEKLEKQTKISKKTFISMKRDEALLKADFILKNVKKNAIDIIFYTDLNYPRRLKQCPDSPLIIYSKGSIDLNKYKYVAVVGTREASDYGKKLCTELIKSFINTDIVVVSGMAYGIDIFTHNLCIQHGVKTIGVMAHGLEIVYPQLHKSTASKMILDGGLISEYPPLTKPDKENFPMRNRIVAGMCDATIVVESKMKGGSLITAELANDYNRDVFSFPGNVFEENSEGCNLLISNNKAHLLRSGIDFLTKMGWNLSVDKAVQRPIFPDLSQEEQEIIYLLEKSGQMNIDTMALTLKVPSSKINVLLFNLEMNGLIATIPGNRCQLV